MIKLNYINDAYISYLRKFDSIVLENKNEKRPYVGIVCTVNNINYFVPLSSPKNKYLNMKNTKDFHKIGNGKYGIINFNNMIPVNKNDLIKIDIEKERDDAVILFFWKKS